MFKIFDPVRFAVRLCKKKTKRNIFRADSKIRPGLISLKRTMKFFAVDNTSKVVSLYPCIFNYGSKLTTY